MKNPIACALLLALSAAPALAQLEVTFLPTAATLKTEWKYTTVEPSAEWSMPDFQDADWSTGLGGFGTEGTPGAAVGTTWNGTDIWLRKSFLLDDPSVLQAPAFKIHHDETVSIYLNGQLVFMESGYSTEYKTHPLGEVARQALQPGFNIIAIHCKQTEGGQYIDVGIVDVQTLNLVEIAPDSRASAQEWTYTTTDPVTSDWLQKDFLADGWTTGFGGFGNVMDGMSGGVATTAWNSPDIWIRRNFPVSEDKTYKSLFLSIFYDEDVEVYLNGHLIYQKSGYLTTYKMDPLSEEFLSLLVAGENTLAAHCRQTDGGQFLDIGLYGVENVTTRARDARMQGRSAAPILRARGGRMAVQAGAGRSGTFDLSGRSLPSAR